MYQFLNHVRKNKVNFLFSIPTMVGLLTVVIVLFSRNSSLSEFARVQYDDSYITFRYASNLAEGNGLRYNPGDNTNSASSLLFVLLLALVHWVSSLPIPQIATILNLLGIFLLGYSASLLQTMAQSKSVKYIGSILSASVIGSFGFLCYWTFSGMETVFFLGLLALAMAQAIRYGTALLRGKQSVYFIGLLTFLSLSRIEGVLAGSVLVICLSVGELWISKDQIFKKLFRLFMISSMPPMVFFLQLLFYWIYYDSPISDPIRFKPLVSYYERPIKESITSIDFFLTSALRPLTHLLILVSVLAVALMLKKLYSSIFLLIIPTSVLLSLTLFVMRSPFSDQYRYELTLFVPVLIICSLLPRFLEDLEHVGIERIFSLVSSLILVGACINFVFHGREQLVQIAASTNTYMYVQAAREDAGKWMEYNTPSGSRVVSSDIGALGYFNPGNVYLDVAGLVDREQLTAVINGGDVYETMKSQSPQFLVDTVTAEGLTGVEQILSKPESYYTPSTKAFSACPALPLFRKKILAMFPQNPTSNLQIQISSIEWIPCPSSMP